MTRLLRLIFTLALLAFIPAVAAMPVRFPDDDIAPLSDKTVGLCIIDLNSGDERLAVNADRRFIPASVTKALTAAAVLSLHDSLETFVTRLALSGTQQGRRLQGNLIIEGAGDPTLGSAYIAPYDSISFPDFIANTLKAREIDTIAGNILLTAPQFIEEPVPDGWMKDDLKYAYGAPHRAFNWADNTRLVTERTRRRTTTRRAADLEPRTSLARALTDTLARRGITVLGQPLPDSPMEEVAQWYSAPYVDILRSLMVRSDNLMAEGMLRALAPGDSRAEALAEEHEFLTDNDLYLTAINIEDGSGLSRNNRMTPRFLARLLHYMAHSTVAPSYIRLFPVAGREGTVANLFADTPLEGRLMLKSGSMRGVQAYAGYILDEQGTPAYAIVMMANDFTESRALLRDRLATLLTNILL